jgi:hypothetical protein
MVIALGLSSTAERFCASFSEMRPRPRRLQLAKELGVHPTALCRSNFKLRPQHLAVAAERLRVSQLFLQHGDLGEAPDWLQPALQVVAEMRMLLRCHCQGSTCGRMTCWLPDRVLVQLGATEAWRRIGASAKQLRRGQLTLIHGILQHRARRGAEQVAISLCVEEWSQVIELLLRDRASPGPRLAARVCAHLRASCCQV